MNAKLGEYCGLVHGNTTEATPDGAAEGGTRGLLEAVALFKGIQRPMIGAGLDRDIYVYVTDPSHSYIYPLTDRSANSGPTRVRRPDGSVFVVYAEMGERASAQLTAWAAQSFPCLSMDGIIHDWEWVLCAADDERLPDRHNTRYTGRIW